MRGPIALATLRTSLILGVRLAMQAGTLLLVARVLGPERFGEFAGVAALAVVIGTLSSFGTNLVFLGEVSKEPGRRMHVLAYALPTTLLCGTLLLAVYLLFAGVYLSASGVSLMVLLAIGAAEILLQPLFAFLSNEHLAMERIARSQVVISLPLVMRLLAASLVFMVDAADPLAAFSFGYLIASAIALSLATATSSAPWPTLRDWRLPSRSELHQSSGYAALAFTACGPGEIDKTLAAVLLTPSSSGLYAAGTRVIGAVTLPVIAMLLSALPRLFREGHTQPRETTRLLRWILVAALLYSALITAVLWLAAPAFMGLFGPGYEGISQMIQWLCLAVPGMALRIAAGSMLMALGRPWMRAGFEIAGVIVLLVCSLMLTGRLGGTGMAVALACAEWTMAALGLALIASARMRAIRPRAA
ncbi:lipopolysaccharide biosynthesis protein [Thauera aminoaromatica]|uniref:Polysaccharide biosynthesis protein n=1 Tax=Thauera aminoaromatica S2 TaxID=1234381 RepID=N6Y1T6_THASP|nr:oligosaccharide flippase family protein [Thauera aminoaromatica]ENO85490.1 polysaccharide biosynthesis protein [Thauera aminoaromatica S2]